MEDPSTPLGPKMIEHIENMLKIDFSLLMKLSQEKYEGAECFGFLKITNSMEFQGVKFRDAIDINGDEFRSIRKLIETANKEYSLIVYNSRIIGIGKAKASNVMMNIEIEGASKWIVYIGETASLKYSSGSFYLGTTNDKSNDFIEIYKQTFQKDNCTDILLNIYKYSTKQSRGTMLVLQILLMVKQIDSQRQIVVLKLTSCQLLMTCCYKE